MAEFVLVPGAWLGSWAWDEVVPALRGRPQCPPVDNTGHWPMFSQPSELAQILLDAAR